MKKLIYFSLGIVAAVLLHLTIVANAAPTSTIVQNLFITNVTSSILGTTASGLVVATTTGGSGAFNATGTPQQVLVFTATSTALGYTGFTFVSSTGVFAAPTGTFAGVLALGTTTPNSGFQLYLYNATNSLYKLEVTAPNGGSTYGSEVSQQWAIPLGVSLQGVANSNDRGLTGTVAGDYFFNVRTGGRIVLSADPSFTRFDLIINSSGTVSIPTSTFIQALRVTSTVTFANTTSALGLFGSGGALSAYGGSTYNPSPNCLTSLTVSATGTLTGTSAGCSGGGTVTTTINQVVGPTFTFNTSSTGTDFTIATDTGNVYLRIPTSSASARGLLSAADWTTFNNKQASGLALLIANNLSDLNSTSSARTNIGFNAGNKISISSTGTIGLTLSAVSQWTNDSGYLANASITATSPITWSAGSVIALTTVPIASGGTGNTAFSNGALIYADSGIFNSSTSLVYATSTKTLSLFGVASSTELRTPSSTITALVFTNATGSTNLSLSYGTASRCLRLDANKNVVVATGDCASGDTTNSGTVTTSSAGVANTVPLWTSTSALGNSLITQNTSSIQIASAPQVSTSVPLFALGLQFQGGNVSGTAFGLNVSSSFNGDLIALQSNSSTKIRVASSGIVAIGTSTIPAGATAYIATTTPIMTVFGTGQVVIGATTTQPDAGINLSVQGTAATSTLYIGNITAASGTVKVGCIAMSMYPTSTAWGYIYLDQRVSGLIVATTTPCP